MADKLQPLNGTDDSGGVRLLRRPALTVLQALANIEESLARVTGHLQSMSASLVSLAESERETVKQIQGSDKAAIENQKWKDFIQRVADDYSETSVENLDPAAFIQEWIDKTNSLEGKAARLEEASNQRMTFLAEDVFYDNGKPVNEIEFMALSPDSQRRIRNLVELYKAVVIRAVQTYGVKKK